jgi:hypothetical protein
VSDDVTFNDGDKKVRKLQVWVTEEVYAKIMGRTNATGRKASEWIRAVIDKHFAEQDTKKKNDEGLLERVEGLLSRLAARLKA